MKKLLVFVIVLALALMGMPNTAAEPLVDTEDPLTMTPDGLYWTDDLRVTTNSAGDLLPQITVDKNHDAHIFWMRDGWYYKKFDRFGNALTKEKQINTVGVGNWFLLPYRGGIIYNILKINFRIINMSPLWLYKSLPVTKCL